MMVKPEAYQKIKPQIAGKDWQIVAFSAKMIVLRIERRNLEFDRSTGSIRSSFAL